MDRTGDHHIKQNKSDLESQVSHVFIHMWNLKILEKDSDRKVEERLLEKRKGVGKV